MAKRKRDIIDGARPQKTARIQEKPVSAALKAAARNQPAASKSKDDIVANSPEEAHANGKTNGTTSPDSGSTETATIQIITGSYERVLHGFTATVPQAAVTGPGPAPTAKDDDSPSITFADTFLFNAHASAIRCLALSPQTSESSKITLATGSTDERINLYSLSTAPPAASSKPTPAQLLPTLHGTSLSENSRNKELGALLHHSSSITALYFPSRSKLLSAAEDSTIAITRTRDWTPLSTIKAPIPKAQGRPSGDTAAPGEVPSGVNDFAVHPSMKLMVSVGKGEKCMRLWNLVTGKKAGVLNFGKDVLVAGGESRFGTGEGRRVVWDREGEEFAVAFERGVVVFGIDCKPRAKIAPTPRTKVHQMQYLASESHPHILVVSTEDGRLLFYNTDSTAPAPAPTSASEKLKDDPIPPCTLAAQLGGPAAGISGRVKDFQILSDTQSSTLIIVTGSSDGAVRIWSLQDSELAPQQKDAAAAAAGEGFTARQIGKLLGTLTTGSRITCLTAFLMTGKPEEAEEEEQEEEPQRIEESSSDEDSE